MISTIRVSVVHPYTHGIPALGEENPERPTCLSNVTIVTVRNVTGTTTTLATTNRFLRPFSEKLELPNKYFVLRVKNGFRR